MIKNRFIINLPCYIIRPVGFKVDKMLECKKSKMLHNAASLRIRMM